MLTREELKEQRICLGWTQADLAKKAEIGLNSVVNYERGRKVRPKTEKAIRATIYHGVMTEGEVVYTV